jgi:UDP-glucose 4-epimerase
MRVLITGGAGFIGSNLAERFLQDGHEVTVVDDLSGGSLDLLAGCRNHPSFRFFEQDLLDLDPLCRILPGHDAVFHLAANSDISECRRRSDIDLRLGTMATYNVLEAMRRSCVRDIVFSSSSVVYGEPAVTPTPEDYGPLLPISLYGASKLACEALISAFCHNYGLRGRICRFANIVGRHGTHGALVDFIRKLRRDPRRLEILGDGCQAKPYLHVTECVDGLIHVWRHSKEQLTFFNLGCRDATTVRRIAEIIVAELGTPGAELHFTGGRRGWPGDVPQVRLDCRKLSRFGWEARLASDQAVQRAAKELVGELMCRQSS